MGNTRARRTNTANRAPNTLLHNNHVLVYVYTEFIELTVANQPVRSAPKLQGDVTVKITKEWKQVDINAPSNCRNTR